MSPWQAVHFRLLSTLPVHTHYRPADPERCYEGHQVRTKIASNHRRQKIRQWSAEGIDKHEMAARLQVCVRTVELHLNALAEETPKIGNGGAAIRQLPGGQKVMRCAGCKVDHDISAFSKGSGPGGLHRHCKVYQRIWRQQRKANTHG